MDSPVVVVDGRNGPISSLTNSAAEDKNNDPNHEAQRY